MKKQIETIYLDYVNNFLTVEKFAEHYNISVERAERIINAGRIINNTKKIYLRFMFDQSGNCEHIFRITQGSSGKKNTGYAQTYWHEGAVFHTSNPWSGGYECNCPIRKDADIILEKDFFQVITKRGSTFMIYSGHKTQTEAIGAVETLLKYFSNMYKPEDIEIVHNRAGKILQKARLADHEAELIANRFNQ